jgi:hypothetical protein
MEKSMTDYDRHSSTVRSPEWLSATAFGGITVNVFRIFQFAVDLTKTAVRLIAAASHQARLP